MQREMRRSQRAKEADSGGPKATFGRPFEVRFCDGMGWGRIAGAIQLPAVLRVMAWCALHLKFDGSMQPVSQARVARDLGISQAQASRALKQLREVAWLDAERVGREWRYRQNMEMGWASGVDRYRAEQTARREFGEYLRENQRRLKREAELPLDEFHNPAPVDDFDNALARWGTKIAENARQAMDGEEGGESRPKRRQDDERGQKASKPASPARVRRI